MSDILPSCEEYRGILLESFEQRYSNNANYWSSDPALAHAAQFIFSFLAPDGRVNILDIGVGTGDKLKRFAPKCSRATALDLVELPEWSQEIDWPAISFVRADFLQWPGPRSDFDLVLDIGCFHHQHPDVYLDYLSKIKFHLKPSGIFGLCVYFENEPEAEVGAVETLDVARLAKRFTVAELCSLLGTAQLSVESTKLLRIYNREKFYLVAIAKPTLGAGK